MWITVLDIFDYCSIGVLDQQVPAGRHRLSGAKHLNIDSWQVKGISLNVIDQIRGVCSGESDETFGVATDQEQICDLSQT